MKEKYCGGCGEVKIIKDFYYSSSYVNRHSETVQLCKKCILDYVEPEYTNVYELSKIKDILRMIDKPFIQKLWEDSCGEGDKMKRDYFGVYMKNLAMRHNKSLTWNDSDFDGIISNSQGQVISVEEDEFENVTEADLKRWKKDWGEDTIDGYLFMDEFFNSYMSNFPTELPSTIITYKNLAKIHRQAEMLLGERKLKEYREFMELSSKLHTDAKIKASQISGAGEDKGLNTYGQWLKDIENLEPAEYIEKRPLFDDMDNIKKYFTKWVLRPMKNVFLKEKDFKVGDD